MCELVVEPEESQQRHVLSFIFGCGLVTYADVLESSVFVGRGNG